MTLRYGAVGCGRAFERHHLPEVVAHGAFDVVALCDVDAERARAVAPSPDVRIAADLDDLFDGGELDVVSVCSPNDAHQAGVEAAAAHGVAVLCEKPLAASLAAGEAIVDCSRDVLVGVNLPYRFAPLVRDMAARLAHDRWHVDLRFSTAGMRAWRPVSRWYDDLGRAGGGVLLDLGIHALDVLDVLLGRSVARGAEAEAGVEDRCTVDFEAERGTATMQLDRRSRSIEFTIVAAGPARIELDVRRGTLTVDGQLVDRSEGAPDREAVRRFLDRASGAAGEIVSADEALDLQRRLAGAYELVAHGGVPA